VKGNRNGGEKSFSPALSYKTGYKSAQAKDDSSIVYMTQMLYEHTLPAVVASIPILRQGLTASLANLHANEEVLSQVALTLSEALSNVIVHAYLDIEPATISASAYVQERTLDVVVKDEGRGLLPRDDSPGLGLGLPLMRQLSRTIRFEPGHGGMGTTVRMSFDLDSPVVPTAFPFLEIA
jgi:serine/threonine-protein kinase RsbW